MPKVIILSGKARSGKDLTATILKEKLMSKGFSSTTIAYADYLKHICKTYLGWNGEKNVAGRELLQFIGTDIVRDRLNKPNFWVDTVIDIIDIIGDLNDFIIITDGRFKNEIEIPKQKLDTVSIRVERPSFDKTLTSSQKEHISETELDNFIFDININNDGDIKELERKIDDIIPLLIGGKDVSRLSRFSKSN